MNMSFFTSPDQFGERIIPTPAVFRLSAVAVVVFLCACGGSGGVSSVLSDAPIGGDAGDIARDGLDDPILADASLQLDDQVCSAEIDIAEFFLTEIDRQWACQIDSDVGTRFDEIYFERSGTANTASGDVWYWNRNLPTDEINLASPGRPSALMTDIGSSNTVLSFRTVNDANVEEIYDCVLVGREVSI